mgnify:CR=1 FL=1
MFPIYGGSQLAFEKRMGNDRVGTVEREREELAKGKKALEQTLKAEYETRLTRALAEADRAYSDERDKFRSGSYIVHAYMCGRGLMLYTAL